MKKGRSPTRHAIGPPYLREWREHYKLSMEALAEKLEGVKDKSWVYKRETGRTPVTADDMVKISSLYRIELSHLFSKPGDFIHDSLEDEVLELSQTDIEGSVLREGAGMALDHTQLAQLVLMLPRDAVPVVGLFITRLLATKEALPHPSKAEKGA